MLDLFPKPWADLDLAAVDEFFASAGEEGATWEAKADDKRGRLHPESLRKAANGLSNRIGGYVILGATFDKATDTWSVPGITPPQEEPELWIGQVLRGLNPPPRHEAKAWPRDGRVVAVVWVDPVDAPPCMTPQGQIYERVSGETLPVLDPARLDALFRRGDEARSRAEQFADRAAQRALNAIPWKSTVGISVALAAIGRETDDIDARLFVRSFRDATVQALWRFFSATDPAQFRRQPSHIESRIEQEALAALADFDEGLVLYAGGGATRRERNTWMLQATWDGTVAAAAAFSPEAATHISGIDEVVLPGWREIAPLVARLGGYGPARLAVLVYAAAPEDEHDAAGPAPRPPAGALYSRLPRLTILRRSVTVGEPDGDVLASLHRELHRAAGQETLEPEDG